ncbi:enoyl-CoA hydratase/isomerase family protein [Nocardioides sp. Y6]|uniref:Enoyl-CoA hydratase/isomerase family protein n=1 Tax=Nocardioides malaquae TaxID=2773426 RepID=A0ABR9RUD2_9ACTN|nr:enoyl-CoA hydratase-related protein [Nocardioides malaquae]MBE7325161.1 enoyl-CoA hydratase/isomerase family protein [Nocardioides malaquae]
MPALSKDGPIWTLDLGTSENRFSPDFLTEVDAALDEIAGSDEPAALLTTGSDKFFSNGLDLEWIMANAGELPSYVDRIHAMFAKVLTLPVPTVAAVNGHAFGGGAMLAIAHDFRVMRSDRGFFCFPEADIRIPFTEGMNALIVAKTTPQTQVASMTTGRRFGGADAAAAGLVDEAVTLEELRDAAVAKVADLAGKDRRTLGTIKQRLYATASAALLEPQPADLTF